MNKNKNQDGKIMKEEIIEDLINLKEEKEIMKSLPSSEISPIIAIKELINSLKEKINIYEKQIKKLIDDKVKLQIDMNAMILQNLQSKKKINNNNNIDNINNKENSIDLNNFDFNNNLEKEKNKIIISSLIDINQKLIEQNKELKEQIDKFKNNLDIYKQKVSKMAEEKKETISSIVSLKKQFEELKSEKLKKDKKKKRDKIKKTESLPNIEQYFILNNKFQLVDSDKNLWHMTKCLKFQEFKKKYEGNNNISSDDILKEFVDIYDSKIEEDKSEENDYLDALNMSANESEDYEQKKNENKYLPPLPNVGNNLKKNYGNKNENDNKNNIMIINNSDIQINIDENEENKKDKENNEKNGKYVNEEKENINHELNENGINFNNNLNEIKEETSFNLSDNTE